MLFQKAKEIYAVSTEKRFDFWNGQNVLAVEAAYSKIFYGRKFTRVHRMCQNAEALGPVP
jgi:hypothetical protein